MSSKSPEQEVPCVKDPSLPHRIFVGLYILRATSRLLSPPSALLQLRLNIERITSSTEASRTIRLTDVSSNTSLRRLIRYTSQAQSPCGVLDLTETRASRASIPMEEDLDDTFGSVYHVCKRSAIQKHLEQCFIKAAHALPPNTANGSLKTSAGKPVCRSPQISSSESGLMDCAAPSQSEMLGLKP